MHREIKLTFIALALTVPFVLSACDECCKAGGGVSVGIGVAAPAPVVVAPRGHWQCTPSGCIWVADPVVPAVVAPVVPAPAVVAPAPAYGWVWIGNRWAWRPHGVVRWHHGRR
jgi:hypothetical protein